MKTDDFDFYLPEELIAQTPLENRSDSRLLVLDRKTGQMEHKKFPDIINYLEKEDVVVLNNTKVMPARLLGTKEKTNANIEIMLLNDQGENVWECMASPVKRIDIGTIVSFGDGTLKAECVLKKEEGIVFFKMIYEGIFLEILDQLGQMPLPPYIYEKLEDKNRYQTVYAKEVGSAAAPTAGLHFTPEILKELENKGVKLCYITLHVGLGTFRPVHVDDVSNHKMHSEYYEISEESADILNEALMDKRRIVTIGTTSVRTLEAAYDKGYKKCSGWTDIFIYPGCEFKVVNSLVTNFHLPKSTLIMLVSALSTKDIILSAYNEAVKEKYRFFSFGDSLFIK